MRSFKVEVLVELEHEQHIHQAFLQRLLFCRKSEGIPSVLKYVGLESCANFVLIESGYRNGAGLCFSSRLSLSARADEKIKQPKNVEKQTILTGKPV